MGWDKFWAIFFTNSSGHTALQGCQMVCLQTKNPNLGKFWRFMQWKILFYGHLAHFTDFCYILWTFGIVRGNLAYFSPFWYLAPRKIWQPCTQAQKVINTGGCLAEFEALVIKNIAAVGGVGVGIALIQVPLPLKATSIRLQVFAITNICNLHCLHTCNQYFLVDQVFCKHFESNF
jgi:hypothetical protein